MEVIMEKDVATQQGMENSPRKDYLKPRVNRIQLVANEAVLSLCKFGEGAGGQALCVPDLLCVSTPRS
jgi:hypothetical protein